MSVFICLFADFLIKVQGKPTRKKLESVKKIKHTHVGCVHFGLFHNAALELRLFLRQMSLLSIEIYKGITYEGI
jgi:hypothetical protein